MRIIPLLLLALFVGCNTLTKKSADLVVTGATIINPESEKDVVGDIVITDGKIIEVGPGASGNYEATKTIEAGGKFVIPGLADMHSHFGNMIIPGDADDSKLVLARHLYFGNTTILNLGSHKAWIGAIDGMRDALKKGKLQGPRLLATGSLITMPGSHPVSTIYSPELQKKIAEVISNHGGDGPIDLAPLRGTTLVRNADELSKEVARVGKWGADAVKITVESGPDEFGDDHPQMSPEMIAASADEAKKFEIPVLCHISSLDELEACLKNGATGVVHAVTSEKPLPEDLELRMIKAGFVVIPTAAMFDGWKRYAADESLLEQVALKPVLSDQEKKIFGSERMRDQFKSDESWDKALVILGKHLKKFHEAGGTIVAGTDTGNPYRFAGFALHEEIAFYVKSGIAPRDALATATTNAAKLVGQEDEWGLIKTGLAADLLILDKNPLDNIENTLLISAVIKAGKEVDRKSLPMR
ncbi:MAG: amidohydrolase family protein [Pyrinomonadaceae bacterium]|nr:amidohydrolase family protein [Pyrinomonadaceae bacterium]